MATLDKSWANLHRPYQPLLSTLQQKNPGDFLILTYKNVSAVQLLCEYFRIPARAEHIFAGDAGTSKVENFRLIRQQFPARQFTFIDDNIHNLMELTTESETLHLIHAAWGYCTSEDKLTAAKLAIPSMQCAEFSAKFQQR